MIFFFFFLAVARYDCLYKTKFFFWNKLNSKGSFILFLLQRLELLKRQTRRRNNKSPPVAPKSPCDAHTGQQHQHIIGFKSNQLSVPLRKSRPFTRDTFARTPTLSSTPFSLLQIQENQNHKCLVSYTKTQILSKMPCTSQLLHTSQYYTYHF